MDRNLIRGLKQKGHDALINEMIGHLPLICHPGWEMNMRREGRPDDESMRMAEYSIADETVPTPTSRTSTTVLPQEGSASAGNVSRAV